MSIYVGKAFLMSIGEKVYSDEDKSFFEKIKEGFPKPEESEGEWQEFGTRLAIGRWGPSFDRWDHDFLFRRTKRRLVRMFRTYFKSREFLSGGDDDNTGQSGFSGAEKDRKRNKKKKDKGMKRMPRKLARRERDRPYDKNGN